MCKTLNITHSATIKNRNCITAQQCRGESDWCLDTTSTRGVWRHTVVRFLPRGDAAPLRKQSSLGSIFCVARMFLRMLPPCIPWARLQFVGCRNTQGFDSSFAAMMHRFADKAHLAMFCMVQMFLKLQQPCIVCVLRKAITPQTT